MSEPNPYLAQALHDADWTDPTIRRRVVGATVVPALRRISASMRDPHVTRSCLQIEAWANGEPLADIDTARLEYIAVRAPSVSEAAAARAVASAVEAARGGETVTAAMQHAADAVAASAGLDATTAEYRRQRAEVEAMWTGDAR